MRGQWYVTLVVTCFLKISFAQEEGQTSNTCYGVKTCGQCIATAADCAWCSDESFDKINRQRCDLFLNLNESCTRKNLFYPSNELTNQRDEPVRDGTGEHDAIQIQPQQVYIKIRPNTPHTFRLKFRQAENYPVDLYYLMDLSNSMEDDKDKLASLGNLIAQNMQAITKNFRLGFGSFVDKVVMPYVSTVKEKLESPCKNCEAPYSFKNQLPLDKDTSKFETYVRRANISGNLDAPEGGFDAIMQTIMCQQIGWRNVSRKLLVYSTDAGFHIAGDGKLGGIVKPNDGYCHLSPAGKYTEAENQDYPSISQIAMKVREKNINVIFAVTDDQVQVYRKLSQYIEGSEAELLANDSSNIVEVIRRNYEKITSKVELNTQYAENITVSFKSSCKGQSFMETNSCEGLSIGDNVTFDVTVSVTQCAPEPSKKLRSFSIYPVGLGEKLDITLEINCECECEKPENDIEKSPLCNGNGTFECGQCTCDEGRYGKKCECDGSETTSEESLKKCINPNDTVSVVCSGRGECICGVCECFPREKNSAQRFSGPYCECNDFSCSYHNDLLCGGRGMCKCGVCQCNEGFTGDACECPTSTDPCKVANGEICNGVGQCKCGSCICNASLSYRGPTCEECPTCPGKCDENKACALCVAFQTGPYTKEECDEKCKHVTPVTKIDEDELSKKPLMSLCQYEDDEDDCVFFFTYEYRQGNKVTVEVQKTKVCPESVNILAIVLGTIGGIVLVGLILLLIWKLFTTIHDRREFAKFEKETQNAKWDTGENPIYQQATSTFKNPMYAGKN
ncbi:hypothetical protein ACJMK2_023420 [Sinanodonta woodiana]|uniref:Integrin beta n=1 Tax=Sinanodonta woodiana TaxID=1069815 RepID=A0ABD3T465_SINWO